MWILRLLFAVLLAVPVCSPHAMAQNSPDQSHQDQNKQEQNPATPPPQSPSAQEPAKPATPESPNGDVKITPRQAEELFHTVDEIMEFDSKQTGLPVKKEVKRKLTSRNEVESYLTKHMNDEDTQRLRRS